MLQQIYHKKNELFEVEFYEDKECTVPFENANRNSDLHLYIDGLNSDITMLLALRNSLFSWQNIYTPYVWEQFKLHKPISTVKTLDDITPNLSKYIPEDHKIIFLHENDFESYDDDDAIFRMDVYNSDMKWDILEGEPYAEDEYGIYYNYYDKATIFLQYLTESELKKANEVVKELKEKYKVKEVNLFVLHCFVDDKKLREIQYDWDNEWLGEVETIFDKIITTNSTGVLEPQNSDRLQVIDCKEIFEDWLEENN